MQAAGAAERHQRESARIIASLDRDVAKRAFHICIDHIDHTMRGGKYTDLTSRGSSHVGG